MRALDNVSFSVGKGETLALVGESGSGKSVTAYAVMGILDPAGRVSGGRAMLDGLDLLSANPRELAKVRGRKMAMIFQNPRTALNPIRQVGRQIADVLIRHGDVTRKAAPAAAVEMLRAVGITDPVRRAKTYPFELSGGMCQRVMIAIALAAKPSLLIADEPTTGLDVTTQAVIMDLISTSRKNSAWRRSSSPTILRWLASARRASSSCMPATSSRRRRPESCSPTRGIPTRRN